MRKYDKIMKIKDREMRVEQATNLWKWVFKKSYTSKRSFKDNIYMRYIEAMDAIDFYHNINQKLFLNGGYDLLEQDLLKVKG